MRDSSYILTVSLCGRIFAIERVKFIHCGDIHLDMPLTSLGKDGDKAGLRRAELRQTFQKIIALAAEEKADLLLICGDMFEHSYVRKSTINFLCDEFRKISDIKVIIITGNHDPDLPGSYYRIHKWPENVIILGAENIKYEDNRLCVFSSPEQKAHPDQSKINIYMAHGSLDIDTGSNTYNPLSSVELEGSGMDYIALGHFHNKIEMAGRRGLAYNPGSPEPLGFDEEGVHGVFISEIIKEKGNVQELKVNYRQLNKRNFWNIIVNPRGIDNHESLLKLVAQQIENTGNCNDLYCVRIKGILDKSFRINKKLLELHLEEKVFFVKIKDESMPDYDFDEIKKELGLRGMFVGKMLRVIEMAKKSGDEEKIQTAQRALYFGLEALEQGEICL